MTVSYLTNAQFKLLTIAPAVYVDQIEADEPGWCQAQLVQGSAWLNDRLKKRYAAPFDPVSPPATVTGWLATIFTEVLYLKRGVDATDEQFDRVVKRAEIAKAEVKEAAESKDGLFDLPLRDDLPGASGVTRGAPLFYSEVSPYRWSEAQRDLAEPEGG